MKQLEGKKGIGKEGSRRKEVKLSQMREVGEKFVGKVKGKNNTLFHGSV